MHDAGNSVGYPTYTVLRKHEAAPAKIPDTENRLANESQNIGTSTETYTVTAPRCSLSRTSEETDICATEKYIETILLTHLDEISRTVEALRGDMINPGRIPSTNEATAMEEMKSQFQRILSVSTLRISTVSQEIS